MKASPARQDGIAALRQRLFFAGELVKLAEQALAGDAINRQGVAMACRSAAVLQLHAVLTGMLDDIVVRLRIDRSPEVPTIALVSAALAAKGMVSPELGRITGMLESGSWLAACVHEGQHCLSSAPVTARDGDAHAGDERDHDHGQKSGMIRMVEARADADSEPLTAGDFARIRQWIAGWKSLLDEFLVTLDEF